MSTPEAFGRLKQHLAEISDLVKVGSLLSWDQQTKMPPAGAAARAEQRATVDRIAHERFVSTETERLLDELRTYEESLDHDSDDASLLRVTRRDFEKASRVTGELRAEMSRAGSRGRAAWVAARASSSFETLLPYLERHLELKHEYIAGFEPADEPYDVLLDDYEPGMKTADVRDVFERVKERLVPLIAEIAERDDPSADDFLQQVYPVDVQRAVVHDVLERFGFDAASWRLDPTAHPFASSIAMSDIRITTSYFDEGLGALFAGMHEFGHGLYEHQVSETLARSPLARGTSLGLHESQSRMWENLVGRSREFAHWVLPQLQQAFPGPLGDVDVDRFYRGINRVHPSLIRIHADEATYNLHIILRFELEQDLIDGRVALRDLPATWNERMQQYLGVDVPDDARGVLQDVHWSSGSIGYFSTYSLGNIISLQIWERVLADIPDLYEQIGRGEFAALREWLGEKLHRHGRKFMPAEMLERVVGSGIDPEPYLRYLEQKHGAAVAS